MNIEKAIEILKEQYTTVSKCLSIKEATEQNTAINLAISALEKQVPKVPTRQKFGAWEIYNGLCINCLTSIRADMNYCPECGQKLDWSEVENE